MIAYFKIMITQFCFCSNALDFSAYVNIKTLISFRKAFGHNNGYLSIEDS